MLHSKGFEVVGICAKGKYCENVRNQGVRVINVPMTRKITIGQDLKCLWLLYRIFIHEKFDIIHYSTPKASLLACIAGRLAGGSALLYTLRGLGYYTFGGLKKRLAKWCENIVCISSHKIIAISPSLKKEAVKEHIISSHRMQVLGMGSSKGVNPDVFKLDKNTKYNAKKIQNDINANKDSVIIGYAGRLSPEKGLK